MIQQRENITGGVVTGHVAVLEWIWADTGGDARVGSAGKKKNFDGKSWT